MYERRQERLISKHAFALRLLRHFLVSFLAVMAALGIGVLGYRFIAGLGWVDSLLNASMILGGMGPIDVHLTSSTGAKIFASLYALFCGLIFVAAAGLLFAPVLHRILHRFHLEDEQ